MNLKSEPQATNEPMKTEAEQKPKFMVRILDKIITLSILMLFFGLPLFFTGLSFQGIAFEKQIYFYFWILVALVVWAAKGVVLGELKVRKTPLDIPIALFWVIYILATIFSVDRWHSFLGFPGDPSRGLLSITSIIIAYYIIFNHFSIGRLKWILTAILSSGAIVSLWTALGIMGVNFAPDKLVGFMPLSLVGSVSGLGIFFSLMLPLIITAIFKIQAHKEGNKIAQKVLVGGLFLNLALNLFLLLALYAFVPWIALLVGIGFFLIFILSLIIRPAENMTWIPMVTFVLLMIVWMLGNGFKIAKINLPTEVNPAYGLSWQVAKNTLKDKLILGSGAATYGYDFSMYKPKEFNLNQLYNLRFYQGTGVFFEALSSIGVLGTIGLTLILLTFLSVSVYLLISRKDRDRVYSLGFVAAALIFIIAGALGRVESTLVLFGALIATVALALVLQESDSEEKCLNLSLKASPKYALTLAFVFMVVSAGVAYLFVFIGKIYAADLYAGSALRQTQVSQEGSIAKLIQAINLNGKEGRYYTRLGQEYMVLANNEIVKDEKARDINAVQGYLNNSIMAANQGKELMKNDALAVETLAQIYENAGLYVADSLNLSEATYKRAQELEPHNPNFLVKLGQLKLSQAMSKKEESDRKQLVSEAKELFQKAIEEKANFSQGYYQLALTKDALGDADGAIESMTKALTFENNNINFVFNLARLYQGRSKGEDNKIAEALFKQILGVNSKEINTHFSLGLLYEKTTRKNDAIDEYKIVLDLLPAGSDQTKKQIQKMISNIQNGVENTPENLKENVETPAVIPAEPTEVAPSVPATPAVTPVQ